MEAFHAINNFFHLNQMIIPGSGYWTVGYGLRPGEVAGDAEAMSTLGALADNIAWLGEMTLSGRTAELRYRKFGSSTGRCPPWDWA